MADEKKKNILAVAWDRIGRRGRFIVGLVGYVGFTAIPFPTTPFTLFFAGVTIANSKVLQKVIVNYRKKNPEKSEKFLNKLLSKKKLPKIIRDIIRDTDPVNYEKAKAERQALRREKASKAGNVIIQENAKELTALEKAKRNRSIYRRMKMRFDIIGKIASKSASQRQIYRS